MSAKEQVRLGLVGDSTLDNIVWVPEPGDCTTFILRSILGSERSVVHNFAADGFRSDEVLFGGNAVLSRAARRAAGDPFPEHTAAPLFRPLGAADAIDPPLTHVVLSVGGNDIREVLGDMARVPEKIHSFHECYPRILQGLRGLAGSPKVVVVFQYPPCAVIEQNTYGIYEAMALLPGSGNGMEKMFALMEHIYRPIVPLCAALGVPIIDLRRSFDAHNTSLYSMQIEPSALGGLLIARLIAHVINNHDFSSASKLYVLPPARHEASHVLRRDCSFDESLIQQEPN